MSQSPAVINAVRNVLTNEQHVMPGHRFSVYLPFWITDEKDKDRWEKAPDLRNEDSAKVKALRPVVADSEQHAVSRLTDALRTRQAALAAQAGAETIEAKSLSPFVTGMGEEHAVENGFAFLGPYGLPYLAGSGVKGVIRRAAEELAADGEGGWSFARVVWLFGFEDNAHLLRLDEERAAGDDEAAALLKRLDKGAPSFAALGADRRHLAGALSFWDVIIKGKLDVDILTPHFGHYYQGTEPPHDAGQPKPNPFLVVAPGAEFTFHVSCAEHRLPESLRGEWRKLLRAAFEHAFSWGGFGAKTAVGYGVLDFRERMEAREAEARERERRHEEEARKRAEAEAQRIHVGDRVVDNETREIGTVEAINGDTAEVDFDGMIDEVPLSQLTKLP